MVKGAGLRTCWSRVRRQPEVFGCENRQSLLILQGALEVFHGKAGPSLIAVQRELKRLSWVKIHK